MHFSKVCLILHEVTVVKNTLAEEQKTAALSQIPNNHLHTNKTHNSDHVNMHDVSHNFVPSF